MIAAFRRCPIVVVLLSLTYGVRAAEIVAVTTPLEKAPEVVGVIAPAVLVKATVPLKLGTVLLNWS